MNKWIYPNIKSNAIIQDIPNSVQNILINRGYKTKEEINEFLSCDINSLLDTSLMKDADKGADIIISAIKNKEQIIIVGDYDCDGVCATAFGMITLKKIGANVNYYVNDRFVDGYGISCSVIDNILNQYPDTKLIITCDNGISAVEAVDYAKKKGLKVVITDHHEPGDIIPAADAVIDPKQKDDTYPFKELCGAGVMFKLMILIYKKLNININKVYWHIDIVALATVGDVVPLVGENRIIVQKGLILINQKPSPVFRILKQITEIKTEVNSHFVLAFIYVPMINAIGRIIGKPNKAIDLFLINNKTELIECIEFLKEVNETRKQMTESQTKRAEDIVEKQKLKNVIVIHDESFHEGLIGLIAGRLKEKYNRPVIVFTKSDDNVLKGSARSINGFHIKNEFDTIKHLIIKHGGHEKAAGLSIERDKFDEFKEAIIQLGQTKLTEGDLVKTYKVDYEINSNKIFIEICEELKMLEPYGEGNPKPNIVLSNFQVTEPPFYMGKEKQHIKFKGNLVSVILWNGTEAYKEQGEPTNMTFLGFPEINTYRDISSLQFTCKDYKVG